VTLADVLLSLRSRLLQASDDNDAELAETLFITFSVLQDISYEYKNESTTSLIVDLVDSARDVASGVKGKLEIPTVEQIQAQFPPATKSS